MSIKSNPVKCFKSEGRNNPRAEKKAELYCQGIFLNNANNRTVLPTRVADRRLYVTDNISRSGTTDNFFFERITVESFDRLTIFSKLIA